MTDTLADVCGDIESWFSSEESKVAAFLNPIIQDVVSAGKADLLQDVEVDAPTIATAFATGGSTAAIAAAETTITAQLSTQGTQLAQTTITALASAAVASAQAASATPASTPPAAS